MTNAEITLQNAIEAKNDGKLNDWEVKFVEQFQSWNKKQLKKLSYKQYVTLRSISEKND